MHRALKPTAGLADSSGTVSVEMGLEPDPKFGLCQQQQQQQQRGGSLGCLAGGPITMTDSSGSHHDLQELEALPASAQIACS
jgi:hypothetical protein